MEDFNIFEGVPVKEQQDEEEQPQKIEDSANQVDYDAIAERQRVDFLSHLRQLKRSLDDAHETCRTVKSKLVGTENSVDGVSLLQVKNHCFAEYLENIAQLASARTCGDPVNGPIDSLVSNRCVLEKIKPLENQMKYQLQKYSEMEKNSSINLRANPSAMIRNNKARVSDHGLLVSADYQPPQVSSALYPQAHDDQVKESKYARSIKAHTKQNVLMDEVAATVRDDPVETGLKAAQNRKVTEFMKKMKEMDEIEEETMQRIPRSKKDRQMLKQLELAQGSLGQILDFGKVSSDKKRSDKKKDKKFDKKNDKKGEHKGGRGKRH